MSSGLVLQSWKQIAEYVGRTERTLQRWEQEFGFPVHRPSGTSRSSVMALTQEIQEWTRGKPSLLQIRGSARLDRVKFMGPPGSLHFMHNSSDCLHHDFAGVNALEYAMLDRLRQCNLLLQTQKALRKNVRNLVKEQRALCNTLKQRRDIRLVEAGKALYFCKRAG